ncbi:MAG: hypothetical protein VYE40_13920 [Myxococcota bacterium]|nr:hypothetical protein [Myxococcota bacterium]
MSELYFDRERARTRLATCLPVRSEECVLLGIEILEYDARIDAMTGGWWSEHLEVAPARPAANGEVIP